MSLNELELKKTNIIELLKKSIDLKNVKEEFVLCKKAEALLADLILSYTYLTNSLTPTPTSISKSYSVTNFLETIQDETVSTSKDATYKDQSSFLDTYDTTMSKNNYLSITETEKDNKISNESLKSFTIEDSIQKYDKYTRERDEKESKTLVWNINNCYDITVFQIYRDQLKSQIEQSDLDENLKQKLNQHNFRQDYTSLEIILKILNSGNKAKKEIIINNLDLLFRWFSIKFKETNSYLVYRIYFILFYVFKILIVENHKLSSYEAKPILEELIHNFRLDNTILCDLNHIYICRFLTLTNDLKFIFETLISSLASNSIKIKIECLKSICYLLLEEKLRINIKKIFSLKWVDSISRLLLEKSSKNELETQTLHVLFILKQEYKFQIPEYQDLLNISIANKMDIYTIKNFFLTNLIEILINKNEILDKKMKDFNNIDLQIQNLINLEELKSKNEDDLAFDLIVLYNFMNNNKKLLVLKNHINQILYNLLEIFRLWIDNDLILNTIVKNIKNMFFVNLSKDFKVESVENLLKTVIFYEILGKEFENFIAPLGEFVLENINSKSIFIVLIRILKSNLNNLDDKLFNTIAKKIVLKAKMSFLILKEDYDELEIEINMLLEYCQLNKIKNQKIRDVLNYLKNNLKTFSSPKPKIEIK